LKKKDVFERLHQSLLNLDEDATEEVANEVIESNLNAVEASDVLTNTIRQIGEKFEKYEIFLPDLMIAAEAMNKALAVLEPEMKKLRLGSASKGTVLIGTVKGDIHDLGKMIVKTMLNAAGFTVIDIGKDVSKSTFLEAAKNYEPDIIGLSATMTTTLPMQKEIIEYFDALGDRDKYKIIIGGAVATSEYSEEIGSDGFAEDAIGTVKLAETLINGGKNL
jgi:trimethylamine corrinoid protein